MVPGDGSETGRGVWAQGQAKAVLIALSVCQPPVTPSRAVHISLEKENKMGVLCVCEQRISFSKTPVEKIKAGD